MGTEQEQKPMEMIQTLYCDKFEELDNGNQVNYEGMWTQYVPEYEHIFNYIEWSPSKKCNTSKEEVIITSVYMATIESFVDNKIHTLKDATKGGNRGGCGHYNWNHGSSCNTGNNNYGNKVWFVEHPEKDSHNLKSMYKRLQFEWNTNKSGSSQITASNGTQENTKYQIYTNQWTTDRNQTPFCQRSAQWDEIAILWL